MTFQHKVKHGRFNSQPPEGGWNKIMKRTFSKNVSTHSRPKAAGVERYKDRFPNLCFNSQPPEGGWIGSKIYEFQGVVSTHSRPKAAGFVGE